MSKPTLKELAAARLARREARRTQRLAERDTREAALYQALPELQEIDRELAQISRQFLQQVAGVLQGASPTTADLQAEADTLRNRRASLLVAAGHDERVLDVLWDCPTCEDKGWVEEILPDGRFRPAKKCQCLIQEEIDDLYRYAGLDGPSRQETFDQFDLSLRPPEHRAHTEHLFAVCQDYARRVTTGECKENLLLVGGVGVGKTFLVSAIANAVISARRTVLYAPFSELLSLLRQASFAEDAKANLADLLSADLLIIDDIGAEKVTEFVVQALFDLLNARIRRAAPMVVTTNLSAEQVEALYGHRIASRLFFGFSIWTVRGEDLRRTLRLRQLRPGT